jgi:hypothetical protein
VPSSTAKATDKGQSEFEQILQALKQAENRARIADEKATEAEQGRREMEHTIESLKNTIEVLAKDVAAFKEENNRKLEEIRTAATLRPSTTRSNTYASVAQPSGPIQFTPPISRTATPQNSSRTPPDATPITRERYSMVLDLVDLKDNNKDLENPGQIRKRIEEAFRAQQETQHIKCTGLRRLAVDSTKYVIELRSKDELATARKDTKWVNIGMKGAKLQGEPWHAVRIDRVNKASVTVQTNSNTVKEDVAKTLGIENDVTINKVNWLSRIKEGNHYGSMVIYLTGAKEANTILERGTFDVLGESAFPRPYTKILGPRRCFKCQKFGHLAFRCPETIEICGNCAQEGHNDKNCESNTTKCSNCKGPHRANDPGCPTFRELRRNVRIQADER